MPISYYEKKTFTNESEISHSALCKLDPEMGGCPQAFINSFVEETKESPSMEKGNLLDSWLEKPSEFAVSELDKPTEKMADFTEQFFSHYLQDNALEKMQTNERFIEFCKQPLSLDLSETFTINDIYTTFTGKKADENEFQVLARSIFFARREAEVNKLWKPDTILNNFQTKCIPYLLFLQKANGKIILDKNTKEILGKCQSSLETHPIANKLIHHPLSMKQVELHWSKTMSTINLNRKARLDNIIVEATIKKITIIDNKTTAKPVALFKDNNFDKYKLGRQLASYKEGFFKSKEITPDGWTVDLINIVTQTTEPYTTQVYKLEPATAFNNYQDLQKIEDRTAFHIRTGIWELTKEEQENGFISI